MPVLQENYLQGGGTKRWLDYFEVHGKRACCCRSLRARITWAGTTW
jgi:hypothetical protein